MYEIMTVDDHYQYEDIEMLWRIGVRYFRINPARIGIALALELFDLIKQFRESKIFVDTAGTKHRIQLSRKSAILSENITLGTDEKEKNDIVIPQELFWEIQVGDVLEIKHNEEFIGIPIVGISGKQAYGYIKKDVSLRNHAHVIIKDRYIENKLLTPTDKMILTQFKADAFGISFADNKELIEEARLFSNVQMYAKIESPIGVSKNQEIINASDGIIIARDDLSYFYRRQQLNEIMFYLIEKCLKNNKECIPASNLFIDLCSGNDLTPYNNDIFQKIKLKKIHFIYCNESVISRHFPMIEKIHSMCKE